MCLGHESSGVITAVGPAAAGAATSTLKVGDRVALEVGLPCRVCELCKSGRYNICPTLVFKSSAKVFPHADGTLTELMNHPIDLCHKLPDSVTFEEGALVEPLAVCLHAVRRSEPGDMAAGGSALVLGAGAIGLLTAAALSVHGFSSIVLADIDASRLKIAETKLAAFNITTYQIPLSGPPADNAAALKSAQDLAASLKTGSPSVPALGFSRIFECTGVTSCIQTGIYAAAPGAKLVLVGMGKPVHDNIPFSAAALREVDIVGVFRYTSKDYQGAVRLFESGKLVGVQGALVTHKVSLADGARGFDLAKKGKDETGAPVVKVIIETGTSSKL